MQVEDEFFAYKNAHFDSIEQQYEHLQSIMHVYIQEEKFEQLSRLLEQEMEPFVFSKVSNLVINSLLEIEPIFNEKSKKHLAMIYTLIGHCYYFYSNKENAKDYYKMAVSFAMEYKDYYALSTALNNHNVLMLDNGSDEILWECSKYGSVFFVNSKRQYNKEFLIRFISHIRLSLRLGRIDYAQQIITKYFEDIPDDATPRFMIQLSLIKAEVLNANNRYEEALTIYHELFKKGIMDLTYRDLILICYERITLMYKSMNEQQLPQEIQRSFDQFFEQLKIDKYMEKYLTMPLSKWNFKDDTFPLNYKEFIKQTNELLLNAPEEGYSLVVVDFKVNSDYAHMMKEILVCANDNLLAAFGEKEILHTRMDETSIAYLVSFSEEEAEVLSREALQKVRDVYPLDQNVLNVIYFAAVNHVENNLTTFEQCQKLANAYIYYEFYK